MTPSQPLTSARFGGHLLPQGGKVSAPNTMLELLAFSPPGWGGALLCGALVTLEIAVLSYAVGLVLGMLGAGRKAQRQRVPLLAGGDLHDRDPRGAGAPAHHPALLRRLRAAITALLSRARPRRVEDQRLCGGGRRARRRAGRLPDGGDPRRDHRHSARPDRGGARLRHAAGAAAAAHRHSRDAADRAARPRQSLDDPPQGHGADQRRRLLRAALCRQAGGRLHEALLPLLLRRRRDLPRDDARLQRRLPAARAAGCAAASRRPARAAMDFSWLANTCRFLSRASGARCS